MHPLVKDLMQRVVLLSKEHHDKDYLYRAARQEFQKNAHLTEEKDILKAVAYGRYLVRQEQAFVRFKTYRTLQKRYNPEFQSTSYQQQAAASSQNGAGTGGFVREQYNEANELNKVIKGLED